MCTVSDKNDSLLQQLPVISKWLAATLAEKLSSIEAQLLAEQERALARIAAEETRATKRLRKECSRLQHEILQGCGSDGAGIGEDSSSSSSQSAASGSRSPSLERKDIRTTAIIETYASKGNKIGEWKPAPECSGISNDPLDSLESTTSPLDFFISGDCQYPDDLTSTSAPRQENCARKAVAVVDTGRRANSLEGQNTLVPKGASHCFACMNATCGAKWLRYNETFSSPRACRSHPGFWSPASAEGYWDGFWACCGAAWTEPGCLRSKHSVVDLRSTKRKCWKCSRLFLQRPGTDASESTEECVDGQQHDYGPEWPDEAAQARWQRSSVDGPGWIAEKASQTKIEPLADHFIRACFMKLGWAYNAFHVNSLHHIASRLKARWRKLDHDTSITQGTLLWYQRRLDRDPKEWRALDSMFAINITRFNRDPLIFEFVQKVAFPELSQLSKKTKAKLVLRIWSCGCSSGEEAWTLKILASLCQVPNKSTTDNPEFGCDTVDELATEIIGTDYSSTMVAQAKSAKYTLNEDNLNRLPSEWLSKAFDLAPERGQHTATIKPGLRDNVFFLVQDVRKEMPKGPFHLICCRHSVFMYFDQDQRISVLRQMLSLMVAGGYLITGANDKIPPGFPELISCNDSGRAPGVYRFYPHLRQRSRSLPPKACKY